MEELEDINNLQIQYINQTRQVRQAVKQVEGSFGGLKKVIASISGAINGAFSGPDMGAFFAEAVTGAAALEDELLVLRLALGKLKAAIGQAFAPIGELVVPLVNQAVFALIRFTKAAGQVMAALFGGAAGSDALAESQTAVAESTTAAGKAAKRTLASFDEIERLSSDSSVSTSGTSVEVAAVSLLPMDDHLSPQLQAIVDKILELVRPLKEIDFSPVTEAFLRLRAAIEPITAALFAGLEWAWHNLLVPIAAWTIEDALPAFLDLLSGAFSVLNSAIEAMMPTVQWLWENLLRPLGQWTGETAISAIGWITELLQNFSTWISENQASMDELLGFLGSFAAAWVVVNGVATAWNAICSVAAAITGVLGGAMNYLTSPIGLAVLAIGSLIAIGTMLAKNWDSISASLTEVWVGVQEVWGGISGFFKDTANGIIGVINAMIRAVAEGINAVIGAVNSMSFSVPDWVPVVGGKRFGFSLSTVSAPQIPYLAQGAVLPANKPFLAMVGDQRHGTNIEAPLATIQQAVGLEMESVVAAMVQIGEQLLREQQALRAAVEGIEVGDSVIGQAAQRYDRRMAVVRGGM